MFTPIEDEIMAAAQLLHRAHRIVCLTGAGVSAESGVPTFRDAATGMWSFFDPQQLASQAGFAVNPGLVWEWYMHRLALVEQAQPNPGHVALARLEELTTNFTLVTQNVDDLHERAGSRHVLHLHGRINHFHCNRCAFDHALTPADRKSATPPRCAGCGGFVRPSVVWFGETLPPRVLDRAWMGSERCDLFLSVGTRGVVYPAAQLPSLARRAGASVIEVNPDRTPITEIAELSLPGLSGEILPVLVKALYDLR